MNTFSFLWIVIFILINYSNTGFSALGRAVSWKS